MLSVVAVESHTVVMTDVQACMNGAAATRPLKGCTHTSSWVGTQLAGAASRRSAMWLFTSHAGSNSQTGETGQTRHGWTSGAPTTGATKGPDALRLSSQILTTCALTPAGQAPAWERAPATAGGAPQRCRAAAGRRAALMHANAALWIAINSLVLYRVRARGACHQSSRQRATTSQCLRVPMQPGIPCPP